MWIIEPPKDLMNRVSGRENLNFLFKQDNFYIMDNHLAAGWCWLQELNPKKKYNLFHIDQHMDLWNETPHEEYEFIKKEPKLSIKEFTALEYKKPNETTPLKVFNYANYIMLINNLFPQWFGTCFFACAAYSQNKNDLNIRYNPYGYELPTNIEEWIDESDEASNLKDPGKWLINIDIDYFFHENSFQIYTDHYISVLCDSIKNCKEKIAVVTVALSPECCGGWDKALRITNLIADQFQIDFNLKC